MNEQTEIRATAPDLAPAALEQRPGTGFEGLTPRRFVAEWLALTVLMAAGYLALGVGAGSIAMVGIAIAYGLWFYLSRRKLPKLSGPARRTQIYAGLYLGSGGVTVMLLLFVVLIAWMATAYDRSVISDLLFFMSGRAVAAAILVALILLALNYLGSLALWRRRGALSGSLRGFIWRDIARPMHSPLWLGAAGAMALFGLVTTAANAHVLAPLVDALIRDREAGVLDVARLFPVLPLGLSTTAALLAVWLGPMSRYTDRLASIARSHLEGGAGLPAWRGAVTAGASTLIVVTILYPLHFGMVAALSSIVGIGQGQAANDAVVDWIAAERDNGLSSKEIAARLTRHGRWTPDAPAAGLAALLPDLGAKLAEQGGTCEIAVAAGAAGAAGAETAYCMRVACPSPVRWQAPPALLLYSSHPSRNLYWSETVYIDVFADGVAAAPGGYCTADGRLAGDFQG